MAVPPLLLAAAVATWTVDEGTRGALVEDHRAPLVTTTIELPVGTWSPWARSHHAEEAFTHQDDDPDRAFRKRADALAASIDLSMGDRSATMTIRCLSADLAPALALAKEILANTRYDRHELKRAESARSIEWRALQTDVSFRMIQAEARSLFKPGDPRRLRYEKPPKVSTDPAELAAVRDRMLRFPGRVIGFAGDLTLDDAKGLADGLLPAPAVELPDDVAPRFLTVNAVESRPREKDVAIGRLTQVYLALGRDSLPWNDPRRPAFLIADHVLGGHFYSRLYVALRHEAGDTYGAGTRERGDVVPAGYAAQTFTRADNAKAIETKLRNVLIRFHDDGITEEERAGAVSYLMGHRAFDRQSASQILRRWMTERRLGLAPGYLDDLVDRAAGLSLPEINAFIRDFYDPARLSLVRVVPKR